MKSITYKICRVLNHLALSALIVTTATVASAQTDTTTVYEEWSAETRTSLSFRVNVAAVRSLLPPGWTVTTSADNPDQTGLTVTFMDRHVVLDPQGRAVGTGSSRYMVMSVQASNAQTGQRGPMILNGISPEGAGAYEVYQTASLASAERVVSGQAEQSSQIQENWRMVSASGDSVSLLLHYQQALPVRQQSTIVIRSGKNTGYTRTYKIDQTNDALGAPGVVGSRISSLDFRVEGPLYSRLFDGTEVLTGVTSTPWYHREIYVP